MSRWGRGCQLQQKPRSLCVPKRATWAMSSNNRLTAAAPKSPSCLVQPEPQRSQERQIDLMFKQSQCWGKTPAPGSVASITCMKWTGKFWQVKKLRDTKAGSTFTLLLRDHDERTHSCRYSIQWKRTMLVFQVSARWGQGRCSGVQGNMRRGESFRIGPRPCHLPVRSLPDVLLHKGNSGRRAFRSEAWFEC